MLFTPISPRIIYSVEVENSPSLSLRYKLVLRTGAKPCHNLSSSANTGSIYPALGFPLSTRLHLYSASIGLLSFSISLLSICLCPYPSPSQLPLFRSFVFITAVLTRLCVTAVIGSSTCKMLAWCTAVYTGDDKLRLDAVILSPFCVM